jgi:hypothetical protein
VSGRTGKSGGTPPCPDTPRSEVLFQVLVPITAEDFAVGDTLVYTPGKPLVVFRAGELEFQEGIADPARFLTDHFDRIRFVCFAEAICPDVPRRDRSHLRPIRGGVR